MAISSLVKTWFTELLLKKNGSSTLINSNEDDFVVIISSEKEYSIRIILEYNKRKYSS